MTLLFFVSYGNAFSQNFEDKDYYLVDSLDLNTLNQADNSLIDSLLNVYHHEKEDSSKLEILGTLIARCENDIWLKYNQILESKAEILSSKNKNAKIYIKYLASALNNYGFHYFGKNEIKKAIYNFEKSIAYSRGIDNKEVIPTALNNLGYIFKQQGDILKALEYYYEALKLNKELDEKEEIAVVLNNIGGIYYYLKEYDKALKHYKESLAIDEKLGNKKGVARLFSNIGSVYQKQNKNNLALNYYEQSIIKYNQIGYKRGEALSLSKATAIELEMLSNNNPRELELILNNFKKTYDVFSSEKDVEGKASSAYNISNTYKRLGKISLAEKYANESILLSKEIGFPESIKSAAKALKEIAILKNDYKRAYSMQELFYKMQDSVDNKNIQEVVIQKQFQYEYEKKTIRDSLKSAETAKINELKFDQEIEEQKLYSYAGVIGSILLLIVVIVMLRGFQIKRKSNLELTAKNKVIEEINIEITDSITYAKRIQQAILPPYSEISGALKECFVFYKPKAIVAGDFYWMQKIDDIVLYAAADCTGHGVPGAMISVVCNSALNRSVKEYGLTEPAAILDKTSELVTETFKRSGGGRDINDGMDIALCALNLKKMEIQFAGANNPLYIIREGKLIEVKGNKQSVGNSYRKGRFDNQTINLSKNDCIYTFSDGYADQFGGAKGKKFMYKQFKNLLLSINDLSMEKQYEKIESEFQIWKGNSFQVDDVCVIGVKI